MRPHQLLVVVTLALGCSRTPPPSGEPTSSVKPESPTHDTSAAPAIAAASAPGATACTRPGGPVCLRFASAEEAFRFVVAKRPLVLAVGEAHAQRGTEHIASSTKRFTELFLPVVAPSSSDVVVELWAPDPKCMKEVKAVATAQKQVTDVQASTNQNEYVVLATKAKASGVTPWLLKPSCEEFSTLADAGADAIGAMLGLVKRLTQTRVAQLLDRNRAGADGGADKTVIAYGGAMHNDLAPAEATKEFSFGPELDRFTGGRYIELDLIVPEYIKKTPTWEKLPWYASFDADRGSPSALEATTLYVLGERSFVLVFPGSKANDKDAGK